MIPGDALPGGFQVGRAPRWHAPPGWEQMGNYGWQTDWVIQNEASGVGFTVTLGLSHDPGTAIIPNEANIPWAVGDPFLVDGVWHQRWRVNWYKREPVYEELYDWTRCSPDCLTYSINKWRYWTLNPGSCGPCYVNQGGGLVAVGTQPSSSATRLHMVHEAYSDFWGRHVWSTVRRYHRNAPGGTKAPANLALFRIQQVWEITKEVSEGQPTSYPTPTDYGLVP